MTVTVTTSKAKEYLSTVLSGMSKHGVEILSEESDVGIAFSVIPKDPRDYPMLIGKAGTNCRLWRRIMRLWKDINAPNIEIHVFIPNPRLIKESYGTVN